MQQPILPSPVNVLKSLKISEIPAGPGYWYLASPYSKYPAGIEQAWRDVCAVGARLVAAGVPFYCPIAETHSIAEAGKIDPLDHGIWMDHDMPLLWASRGILVADMDGWQDSYGVGAEIEFAKSEGKPVYLLKPGSGGDH